MALPFKLRLRLDVIAQYAEPFLLERLRALPRRVLLAFQRRYGLCRCKFAAPRRRKHEPGRAPPRTPAVTAPMDLPIDGCNGCRCGNLARAQRLSLRVHALLLELLWPRLYGEPRAPVLPSAAATTLDKHLDLAARRSRRLSLWHPEDHLQADTYDRLCLTLVATLERSVNGYDQRQGWRQVKRAA